MSASPGGDEVPTVNGQAESSVDGVDREPELEPAEEVTENGPTGGSAPREDLNLTREFSRLQIHSHFTLVYRITNRSCLILPHQTLPR